MAARLPVLDLGISPRDLFNQFEDHFTGTDDPYHQLYQQTIEAQLDTDHGFEARLLLPLFEIEAGNELERAVRAGGFVLGFEVCRQLLLGEVGPLTLRSKGASENADR